MSRVDNGKDTHIRHEWTPTEVSIRYQAPAAATMVVPPVGQRQMPDAEVFRLTIDVRRVRGWLEGHRALYPTASGRQYSAVFEPELAAGFEGVFNARIEELPGCVSYGEDLASAKANLREALDLYLEEATEEQS